jgi:sugar lactone lactonase YvrE
VDGAGNVYAADRNNHRIMKFTSDGALLQTFGSFGSQPGQLSAPEGVAVDSAGNIYVAEYSGNRVQKFDPNGAPIMVIGGGRGTGDGQFELPTDLALDALGNIYVADDGNNRVQRFDPSGAFSTKWGSAGTADGQFLGSRGVAIGGSGGVYVVDATNRRIQKFTVDGTFLGKFGDITLFNRPADVAERSGNLYVADFGGHSISRFTEAQVGGEGPLPSPVVGVAVNVAVVRGTVTVAMPSAAARASGARASQKGLEFVPLTADRQIPVGSFLDTRRGTVELVSATGRGAKTQAGRFNAGLFQVLQGRARRARGLTELRLKGSSFKRCRARAGRSAAGRAGAAQVSRRTIRRLRANARGRFRTRGRNSSATVRGTIWTTTDRCDGTLTKVSRGRVVVRDLRRRRNITLTAGKSYLARAPR